MITLGNKIQFFFTKRVHYVTKMYFFTNILSLVIIFCNQNIFSPQKKLSLNEQVIVVPAA